MSKTGSRHSYMVLMMR